MIESFYLYQGARRKPQRPKEAEVEAPQSVENDVNALPDYDIGLDGLADYKPTKGVGSSSGTVLIRA